MTSQRAEIASGRLKASCKSAVAYIKSERKTEERNEQMSSIAFLLELYEAVKA